MSANWNLFRKRIDKDFEIVCLPSDWDSCIFTNDNNSQLSTSSNLYGFMRIIKEIRNGFILYQRGCFIFLTQKEVDSKICNGKKGEKRLMISTWENSNQNLCV